MKKLAKFGPWIISLFCCALMLSTALAGDARKKSADDQSAKKADATEPAQEAAPSHICPKCNNTMEGGYVLDVRPIGSSGGGYDPEPAEWVQGPIRNGFFSGMKIKVRHRIDAYRCTSCSYVEMYAK